MFKQVKPNNKKYQLNSLIPELIDIDNYQAEKISAGRFTYHFGAESGFIDDDEVEGLSIREATQLCLINGNSNRENSNDAGHNFTITFYDSLGGEIATENITHGHGISDSRLSELKSQGAVNIDIVQETNLFQSVMRRLPREIPTPGDLGII